MGDKKVAILLIIIAMLIGIGGGYGAFTYSKNLQPPPLSQNVAVEQAVVQQVSVASEDNEGLNTESKKFLYDNDEITMEGVVVFLKMRAQMQGLPEDAIRNMIRTFERMSKKMPVIDSFKIVAVKYNLMEFVEFKEPKLRGL